MAIAGSSYHSLEVEAQREECGIIKAWKLRGSVPCSTVSGTAQLVVESLSSWKESYRGGTQIFEPNMCLAAVDTSEEHNQTDLSINNTTMISSFYWKSQKAKKRASPFFLLLPESFHLHSLSMNCNRDSAAKAECGFQSFSPYITKPEERVLALRLRAIA